MRDFRKNLIHCRWEGGIVVVDHLIMINGEPNHYIKLYREEMTDPILHKSDDYFAVWQTLKFLANIGFSHSILGRKLQAIGPGQLLIKPRELKERVETNFKKIDLSVSTYNRILKFFQSEKRLKLKTSPSGTVITLLYYFGENPKFPIISANKKRTPANDLPQVDSGNIYKYLDNYLHTPQKEGFNYCEVAENGITTRIPKKVIELENYCFNLPDSFRSIYDYRESFFEHFTSIQSVSGYSGLRYGNWLIFDIDRLKQPDKGLKDVINFIERLHAIYGVEYDQILVYFSGHKGFHVYLNLSNLEDGSPQKI